MKKHFIKRIVAGAISGMMLLLASVPAFAAGNAATTASCSLETTIDPDGGVTFRLKGFLEADPDIVSGTPNFHVGLSSAIDVAPAAVAQESANPEASLKKFESGYRIKDHFFSYGRKGFDSTVDTAMTENTYGGTVNVLEDSLSGTRWVFDVSVTYTAQKAEQILAALDSAGHIYFQPWAYSYKENGTRKSYYYITENKSAGGSSEAEHLKQAFCNHSYKGSDNGASGHSIKCERCGLVKTAHEAHDSAVQDSTSRPGQIITRCSVCGHEMGSVNSSYRITYDLRGGREEKANPTSYAPDSEDIVLNAPIRDGYTFKGWTGSNGSVPQTGVTIAKGTNKELGYVANWVKAVETRTGDITGNEFGTK